uniref:Uncharacterized protein n=1 Tax=Zea mays TaxID=4577 RepID=C0PL62_MAIZE|nr:unknown [Zea mays]
MELFKLASGRAERAHRCEIWDTGPIPRLLQLSVFRREGSDLRVLLRQLRLQLHDLRALLVGAVRFHRRAVVLPDHFLSLLFLRLLILGHVHRRLTAAAANDLADLSRALVLLVPRLGPDDLKHIGRRDVYAALLLGCRLRQLQLLGLLGDFDPRRRGGERSGGGGGGWASLGTDALLGLLERDLRVLLGGLGGRELLPQLLELLLHLPQLALQLRNTCSRRTLLLGQRAARRDPGATPVGDGAVVRAIRLGAGRRLEVQRRALRRPQRRLVAPGSRHGLPRVRGGGGGCGARSPTLPA